MSEKSSQNVLEAADASRLALLAYQVVLGEKVDRSWVKQLDTPKARSVGRAVIGLPEKDSDSRKLAEQLLQWVRTNSGLELAASNGRR